MTEEQKSFTVKDRRHFTADGRTREPDAEEKTSPEPDPAAVGTSPAPSPSPAPPPPAPPPPAAAAAAPRVEPARSEGTVEFAQFILSLGAQAGMLLSGPVEGLSPQEGLAEARSLIAVLEMLQRKTEGRRDAREEEVLEGLLYELRMAYVARAREAGE